MPKQFSWEITARFGELASLGYGATEIHRILEAVDGAYAPSLRTVKAWVADRKKALGEPWRIDQAAPEDAAIILAVLAGLVFESEARIQHIPNEVAIWITRLYRIAPDLVDAPPQMPPNPQRPPGSVFNRDRHFSGYVWLFMIAEHYAFRMSEGDPVDDLDAYLGFAPWRGTEEFSRYATAVDQGWVIEPPPALGFHAYDYGAMDWPYPQWIMRQLNRGKEESNDQ